MSALKVHVITELRRRKNSMFVMAVDTSKRILKIYLNSDEHVTKMAKHANLIVKNFSLKVEEKSCTMWLKENTLVIYLIFID